MVGKSKQWGRIEYEDDFLEMVIDRIASKIPGAEDLDLRVEFRKKMSGVGAAGAEGLHSFDPSGNFHTITMDKVLLTRDLEYVCAVLAHEIGHAVQRVSGRLKSGKGRTAIWDGEVYSYDVPWDERPWERDALEYEPYGVSVFEDLKAEGLVPESKTKKKMAEIYAKHPEMKVSPITMSDLPEDLTREQLLRAVAITKSNPGISLDELLASL